MIVRRVVGVVASLLVAGCASTSGSPADVGQSGPGSPVVETSSSPTVVGDTDASKTAGRCLTDNPANVDFGNSVDLVATTHTWLKLTRSTPDLARYAADPQNGTVSALLSLQPVGLAGSTGSTGSTGSAMWTLRIHGSMLPAAKSALDSGGSVFLGLSANTDDEVLFTLIVDARGRHYFSGDCAYFFLTKPLQSALGTSFDDAMSKLIGLDGEDAIKHLLEPVGASSASTAGPSLINLDPTDPKSLPSGLVHTQLVLEIPPEWRMPDHALCTAISQGLNECLLLNGAWGGSRPEIGAYVGHPATLRFVLGTGTAGQFDTLTTLRIPTSDLKKISGIGGGVLRIRLSGEIKPTGQSNAVTAEVVASASKHDLTDPAVLRAIYD